MDKDVARRGNDVRSLRDKVGTIGRELRKRRGARRQDTEVARRPTKWTPKLAEVLKRSLAEGRCPKQISSC
jgi:hypothetical protein